MTGKLALSKAGHDKNTLYLIIKEEQDMVYLSDGCGRDLLHPKKKNRKHVQLINDGVTRKNWLVSWRIPPGAIIRSERK